MILTDPRGLPSTTRIGARATLDQLLHRAAQRRPDAMALSDPPNRATFTDGAPRQLTFAQADRIVSAIAARMRCLGLATDAVVGIQMANTVESVLTLLGVLRAGLVAMPLPLLWRRVEAVAALSRVGAHALIVSGRVDAVDHFDLAMQIAVEIFPIRQVCGYGQSIPDGVVAFDDLFAAEAELDPPPAPDDEHGGEPGAHVAVITWDVTAEGPIPVARSHAELIAGGLTIVLEGRLPQDVRLLSSLAMSSFAGLGVSVIPWLLLGGTLALHHPFDPAVWREQCKSADAIVVPGPLVQQLVASGLANGERLSSIIVLWRAPDRIARMPAWREATRMVDVQAFGETGFLAAARQADGRPMPTNFGTVYSPRGPKGTVIAAEVAATALGTIALRGPMVPRASFPPGADRGGLPCFRVTTNGFADTGYRCHADRTEVVIAAPPPAMVGIGGYRFVLHDLEEIVKCIDEGAATLAVLPDGLAGSRLVGSCADPHTTRAALADLGVNPLLVDAFTDRPRSAA